MHKTTRLEGLSTNQRFTHLVVGDQQQAHQRGVEDGLGDVGRLSLEALLGDQGSTQALNVDASGSGHPIFLSVDRASQINASKWVDFFACGVKGEQSLLVVVQKPPDRESPLSFFSQAERKRTGLI